MKEARLAPYKASKDDLILFSSIGEYQVLTARQLAAISGRSSQVIRRRLRSFEDSGLIIKKPFGYGRSQGRPEEVVLLSQRGIELLSTCEPSAAIPTSNAEIRSHVLDHELLLNWFRIHLIEIERVIPCLSVKYLSARALSRSDKINRLRLPVKHDQNNLMTIIPDGIFAILNKESGKALLFFVEVDMDSEVLVSKKRKTGTIHQKIISYHELYRNGYYKNLEEVFKASFRGFRLLFLTSTEARSASLCRLAHAFPNPSFIWLTNQAQMFEHGLAANIWVRGCKYDDPRQSILGSSLAASSALKPSIR